MVMAVFLSIVACYLALSIEQFCSIKYYKTHRKQFLLVSAVLISLGVWFLRFSAMKLHYTAYTYSIDYLLTFLSFLIVLLSTIFSFFLVQRKNLTKINWFSCLTIMGLGMIGMHYVSIMALKIENYSFVYNPFLVAVSIVIAIIGTASCFWLWFKCKIFTAMRYKVGLSLFITLIAILIHVAATQSVSLQIQSTLLQPIYLATNYSLTIFLIVLVTTLIFVVALFITSLDYKLNLRNRQLMKANLDLKYQNSKDSLTKLPNRAFLRNYAQKILAKHAEKQGSCAFLYINLDHFRAINDTFGYHIGDHLLIQLSNRMHKYVDRNKKLIRLGNDDFLFILETATKEYAIFIAEYLQDILNENFKVANKELKMTASIGIVMYPEHGSNLHELLLHAEAAMRISKERGRNTYTVYQESKAQKDSKGQRELAHDLYRALEQDQFVLFYQPKFKLGTSQICGVEALIRWQHDAHGLLTPNQFLKGAEKTGQIIEMGYWTLEKVFQQIKKWETEQIDLFPLAVNLSTVQFEHQDLLINLENLFKRYAICPSHLMIEMTESMAVNEITSSTETFFRLRNMGIQLAIDDFGTGYSNFQYLKDFPAHELKIDRSFVLDIETSPKDRVILGCILDLVSKLGLVATVEGVETQEQAKILMELGCQQVQGYLFSRPLPLAQLEALYHQQKIAQPL